MAAGGDTGRRARYRTFCSVGDERELRSVERVSLRLTRTDARHADARGMPSRAAPGLKQAAQKVAVERFRRCLWMTVFAVGDGNIVGDDWGRGGRAIPTRRAGDFFVDSPKGVGDSASNGMQGSKLEVFAAAALKS